MGPCSTKEMLQPCLIYLHVISLVLPRDLRVTGSECPLAAECNAVMRRCIVAVSQQRQQDYCHARKPHRLEDLGDFHFAARALEAPAVCNGRDTVDPGLATPWCIRLAVRQVDRMGRGALVRWGAGGSPSRLSWPGHPRRRARGRPVRRARRLGSRASQRSWPAESREGLC